MPTTLEANSAEMPQLTEDQLEQAIVGDLIVIWQGQRLPLKLQRNELAAYRKAQECGYVIVRRRRLNLPFAFSTWCDLNNRPSIKVEVRRVYADVQLHLITASPRRLSATDQDVLGQHFKRFMAKDAFYSLGELYSYCSKVRTDKAQVLAQAMQLLLQRSAARELSLEDLEGDAFQRAVATGYLVLPPTPDADSLKRHWRAWCHRHRRPTITLHPEDNTPGSAFTLELLPTQYASTRFQQLTVEDVRRLLLAIVRNTPQCLEAVLAGDTNELSSPMMRSNYLSNAALSIGPQPLRTMCQLAMAMLSSLGVQTGQPTIEPPEYVAAEPVGLPLFDGNS